MIYVDRGRQLLSCSSDHKENRPFFMFMFPWNPFSDSKWYYRLYCLGLGHLGFFGKYFGKYGIMLVLTLAIPFLLIEVESFHIPFAKDSVTRFDRYTESFFLLRVSPLWVNTIFSTCLRVTWYSYIDSDSAGRFSFWIEDVFLRNIASGLLMSFSIFLLWWRDKKETEIEPVEEHDKSGVPEGGDVNSC